MHPDLADRIVIVTGASGRLGRVVVDRLAASGARVAALDLDAPANLPDGARGWAADATDEHAVARAFEAVAEKMGAPWALVHTVGTWDGGPLAQTEVGAWRRVMDLNLTSAFVCVREAVRRGAGRVVCVASRQGADRAPAEQAAYAASKAGVIRLVEATAAEHPETGAVAVAPSMILFGGESGAGVSAEAVAELCVRLCGEAGAVHAGATLRAYGNG